MIRQGEEGAVALLVFISIIAAIVICIVTSINIKNNTMQVEYDSLDETYTQAIEELNNENYTESLILLEKSGDYQDSEIIIEELKILAMQNNYSRIEIDEFYNVYYINSERDVVKVDSSGEHTSLGLSNIISIDCSNAGSIYCVSSNGDAYEVDKYNNVTTYSYDEDIVKVAYGINALTFLLKDGTVECESIKNSFERKLAKWENIIDISAGGATSGGFLGIFVQTPYVVGLQSDGTLTFSQSGDLKSSAENWTDITKVFSDSSCILGINTDGNVKFTTIGEDMESIHSWTNVTDVQMGVFIDVKNYNTLPFVKNYSGYYNYIVALKDDGTIVESFDYHGSELENFSDIIEFDLKSYKIIGITSDGKVMHTNIYDVKSSEIIIEDWDIISD